jgi:hypothetical protein
LAHITHDILAAHAKDKVNVTSDKAEQRRDQVNHLRTRLETHIPAHTGYDLVKLRRSGSTAKHTAIRGGGSDADVAAYVRASAVGGVTAPEAGLLDPRHYGTSCAMARAIAWQASGPNCA